MTISNKWFAEKNGKSRRVHVTTVKELLHAISEGEIGLPSFQRGSAWRPDQKVRLWDSVLKGFPIGGFIVFRPRGKLHPRAFGVHKPQNTGTTDAAAFKWLLLDGQQRCAALALAGVLGKESEMSERLWVDAVAVEKNGKAQKEGKVVFHITTIAHPWGVEAKEQDKLDEARERLKNAVEDPHTICRKKNVQRDKLDKRICQKERFWAYPDPWLDLRHTWPVKAERPIPLDALLAQELDDLDFIERIRSLLPKALPDEKVIDAEHGKALMDLQKRLLGYEIALINGEIGLEKERPERVPAVLEMMFARINREGTRVSEGELFFSAIKRRFPEAHDYVECIHRDRDAGGVLTPVQIVHAAARLARSENRPEGLDLSPLDGEEPDAACLEKVTDIPKLSRSRYESLLKDERFGDADSFIKRLTHRLSKATPPDALGDDRQGLHETLKAVRNALSYKPPKRGEGDSSEEIDIGLPLPLLARLHWTTWHTLAGWVATRAEPITSPDREEMIRFALVQHFFFLSSRAEAEDGIRRPFQIARCGERFPGVRIYRWLKAKNYLFAYAAYRHEEWKRMKGILLSEQYKELTEEPKDKDMYYILQNEHDLLFWSQRDWVHRWFDDIYDPLHHEHKADQPFDIDHIVASDWFKYPAGKGGDFEKYRHLKDRIGNLRVLPRSLNRAESNKLLGERYLVGSKDTKLGCNYTVWEMYKVEQLRQASRFDAGDGSPEDRAWQEFAELTEKAGSIKDWSNDARIKAFKNAVNGRRCRLYRELFETLLSTWEPQS